MTSRSSFWAALLAAAALIAPAGARAADDAPAALPGSHVGKLRGTRAYVAISFHDGRLRAYVCDGRGRRAATLAQWFETRWDGHRPLRIARGGVRLRIHAVRPGGTITGRVAASGRSHRFSLVPALGPAGLYDGMISVGGGVRLRASTIVLRDRSSRGAVVCPLKPVRRCRVITVALSDGTTLQRVECFEVPPPGCLGS